MTHPRQFSKSTLVAVILFTLLIALSWKLHEIHQRSQDRLKERVLNAVSAASQPSVPQPFTFTRPWLHSTNGASLFAFTDSEWNTLLNLYPDKLAKIASPPTLIFTEGPVVSVSESVFESLAAELPPSCLRTNPVWFLKP